MWGQPLLPIQLKRRDNVQQQTPLQNTVMQIAFSDISPGSKENSPKVSSYRRAPECSTLYFPVS